ncbi:hypothetical protein TIFTF001_027259 [Ficus carica]|uniref:Uncharacterized protein n=1 Tax=Ficus carica TaxID=3494 RepID=A0AA88DMU1_FICCA|nr:hypothetical protein TIFTF001_027259 [Ficus carica]
MPRTKKVAHKQSRRRPRDTTTSYRTFQSDEAKDRYEKFTYERFFSLEKCFCCKTPPLWGEGKKMVYARGVQVPIDKDTIYRLYGLEGADNLNTVFIENTDEIRLEHVCVEGTTWNSFAQGAMTMLRNNLTPQYKSPLSRAAPLMWVNSFTKNSVLVRASSGVIRTPPKIMRPDNEKEPKTFYDQPCHHHGGLWFPSLITCLCSRSSVTVFDTEDRLLLKGAITTIAITRITQIKINRGNQEQPHIDGNKQDPASQPTTSRNAVASSSRGPIPAELTQSLKMLEQRMSLHEDVGSTGKSTWDEAYSDPVQVPIGPITRARAKKFKDALNGLIQATWSQAIAWRSIEGITSDDRPNKCVIQVLEETE